ncbi:MAG: hypothetical protein RTU63_01440 [Candidatus Thorarchaeota archaeon]
MRRSSGLTLVLIALFVLSLASPYNLDTSTDTSLTNPSLSEPGLFAEGGTAYTGVGSALDVSFSGTFANASPWTASSSTLSNLLTPGVSYSVENTSAVTWTANVLVSPPINVSTLSFSVNFPVTDWKPVSVADPLGVERTNPTEWYQDYDTIIVTTAAVDIHGVWTLTFTATNHLVDLEMGVSGGPYYSDTTSFDTGDNIRFGVSSSWITGAGAEFDLLDPSGTVRYTLTDTTSGSITHALPSFRYHKDITIHNAYVTGDLTDFPVLIDIIDSDLKTDVQTDGDDIVFYSNGIILAHEIELFDQAYSGSDAHLVAWVRANLSNSVDTTITMYYGNPEVGAQSQPEDVWTSNYAAVWHLNEDATDEGTSTDHLDSTGNGYYGDQSGNNDITGIFGVGQNFDGTDDVVNIASARGLEPSGDVTMSGWFKLDSLHNSNNGPTQVLLTKAIDGDTDMHVLLAGNDYTRTDIPQGSLVFKMENGGLGQMYVWSLRKTWSAGVWYFFTCTMTASTPSLNKVFVNGQDNTNTTTGALSTANLGFTDDWVIGGGFVDQLSPTYGWFDGVIDEVRVVNEIRSTPWIQTEWLMYQSSSNFRTLAAENVQTSPDMYVEQIIGASDPAGLWTVSTHYNDSGSSVSHRVGEYQRNFIVRRASTLAITSPTDAVAGLESLTVGDMLYLVVDLSDSGTADPAIGATVSMNWTTPSTVYFEDLGDGRYSIARNTSELNDKRRWNLKIDSTHPYYFDAADNFNLDLYHPTQLSYEWVSTTPVGSDVTATLVYRDAWDGSLISGATITLGDGTPVTSTAWGAGRYNVTIDADALVAGVYSEIFNATKSSDLYKMASTNVTYVMRPHYTAVSVSGNLETPYGEDTTINIVLIDLDTGLPLDASVVGSLSFVSSEGTQSEPSVSNLNGIILDTNTWAVAPLYSVELSLVMSDSDYYAPDPYSFDVEIRNHLTAVTVIGDLTTAYGANTTLTVSLTDLDGGVIGFGSVTSFTFTSSQPIQIYPSPSGFTIDLDTDNWPVSTIVVNLAVDLSGSVYDDPTPYVFSITIRSLQTTLYNAPSNLLFAQESDFTIDLHFNVSESGTYYGQAIDVLAGEFVVTPYPTTVTPLGNGMYRLTIAWSNFDGQGDEFTINVNVNPSSNLYASASMVISFEYRPIDSDLTANLYTISTPYNMDVTLHLYFTDRDSGTGITTATIGADSVTITNGAPHIANGDYLVILDTSTLAIGSYDVNLTASAIGYNTKWVIVTIIVTQIHTDAEPSTIRLEIPSGNTEIFFIDWTDLDNSLAIDDVGASHLTNWTGSVAPVIVWTGTQWQITFETTGTDVLGTYLVWFNFTKGAEYQSGYCEIQIEIRSHDTILTADTPPPTAYNAIINISAYFYDFDNSVGIKDALVNIYVHNASGLVISTFEDNLILGDGFYIIHISAAQFGLGAQTFTIYVEWLGAIQQYENNNVVVAASVEGVDSLLTLTIAADPSAYSETMTYEFLYSEQDSGIGITDSIDQGYGTGHVDISVVFDVAFDMGKVTITEVNAVTDPGLYRIEIDTTGFDSVGQFTMTITIDWTGTDPFYATLENSVSVWVLARDTVLLINPPSPQSYGEIASFTFSWQDTGTSTNILLSGELTVTPDFTTESLTHNAGIFTVTFNTSQFAGTGTFVMTLDITWDGAPFYTNRTSLISITVLNRQTTLDYPTPDPTFYNDNVTITVTWTDVTNGGSDGISGVIITVTDDSGVIPPAEYTLTPLPNGVYQIEFNTSRFITTGLKQITIQVSVAETWIADRSISRDLNVLERRTILSFEAIGKIAYGDPIEYTLYFDDLYTSKSIGNSSGDVTLAISTPGTWIFTSSWDAGNEWYIVTITSYPDVGIGNPSDIAFSMSYDNIAPFYASDDVTATFELRERLSLLSLEVAPNPTSYLDDAVFLVQFSDVDSSTGIAADDIEVYFSVTQLLLGSEYTFTPFGGGFYEITVNSTVLGGTIGQKGITVHAYWTSGAPYHNNASASVNIRVTTRDTIVDITTPPAQTPFLDDVTFTFEYGDLLRGTAITSILTTDITLYNNGTLVDSGDYSLTSSGSGFIFTVDSETLGIGLGRYNLTIIVDWNQATAPYYVDAQTTTWVTVTTRTLSFALDPLDETQYGHQMNISFTVYDLSTGTPVDGVSITFDAQTVSLTLGVDYFITPQGSGQYLIEIDTIPFGAPGDFLFDLDIGWNPSTSPYYKSMNTLELTGVISDYETTLIVHYDQITVNWGSLANLAVNYSDLIGPNPISDATVEWESSVFGAGSFSEFPISSGTYTASIDTGAPHDAGTYIISIRASKDNYELARAYITIVVQPLESDIVPIDPNIPVYPINRGAALTITILLEDALTNPIDDQYVIAGLVQATVEGGGTFILSYSGTPGYYTVTLPENDVNATKRAPSSYQIIITAAMDNYEPAAYSFKILVLQTATEVQLTGDTTIDMSRTYTENVTVYVQLILPDTPLKDPFWNATIEWAVIGSSVDGVFTHNGNGNFSATIHTTDIGFGIWIIQFKAEPFANSSLYAGSSTTISFAIKRIPTSSIPPETRDFYWGWEGNLRFIYWDEAFEQGIPGANVTIELPGLESVVLDVGNGTYLVYFDTSLLRASTLYIPLPVSFNKANYAPSSATIQIRVLEVPTDIFVSAVEYTPDYAGEIPDFEDLDIVNLEIPYGDSMKITFYYNDTENSEGYVGGLPEAIATLNSYLRGPSFDGYLNITLTDLGNGIYQIEFDTLQSEILGRVDPEAYRLYVEMGLENRSITDVLFRITIINVPTDLTILSTQPVWNLVNGESITIELQYLDTWHGTGIVGAYFSANASTGAPFSATYEEGPTDGQYFVTISASGIKLTPGSGTVVIILGDGVYTLGEDTLVVELSQSGFDILVTNGITYGIPLVFLVLLLGFAYVRVWNVPKRLRQINGMIKALRKGKVPKPVTEAASRQDLVAELFNDTYAKLDITRTPDQMPEESIPVDVPELGELLIQLAILTNLDQQELDDFKADIAKMKISEQAAFVKEVIVQEAIRAARRDHKTVEEILEEVQTQAASRLAGEGEGVVEDVKDGVVPEEVEPEVDTVILPDKADTPDTDDTDDIETSDTEVVGDHSDKLSSFEIDELKKDLENRGVPAHEIDVILNQARELPRDLVEELIRSLGRD